MAGNNNDNPTQWLKFLNYSPEIRKACKKELKGLKAKTIEGPEALNLDEFERVDEGDALKRLKKRCNIVFRHGEDKFLCKAWLKVFTVNEPVIHEYVWEFLASVDFVEHITSLTEKCLFFQLGGVQRSMSMNEYILAMGLYIRRQIESDIFKEYYSRCLREKPHNYNPSVYFLQISNAGNYESRAPPSYRSIRCPIRRLVHRLLAVSIRARHSAREKMTMEDIFLMHSMDGGDNVDIPWYLARFMTGRAKGAQEGSLIQGAHYISRLARSFYLMTPAALARVTIGTDTTLIGIPKLVEYGVVTYNALMDPILEPEVDATGAGPSQASGSRGSVRARPTMTMMERMNLMDGRMGHMEQSMIGFGNDMDDMTAAVSGMNYMFDGLCTDFRALQVQQNDYFQWNADRTSQMLQHMHLSHPRWTGPEYVYLPDMPGMGVQHGVSFMHPGSSSTAPPDPYVSAAPSFTPMEHDQE